MTKWGCCCSCGDWRRPVKDLRAIDAIVGASVKGSMELRGFMFLFL